MCLLRGQLFLHNSLLEKQLHVLARELLLLSILNLLVAIK